jgi:hypothetical protein
MVHAIAELLQKVEISELRGDGALQTFGLRWTNGQPLTYQTMDEALAAEMLEICEVTEGGSVNTLRVINKSDSMVFLMAGEHLVGAKQNRVLNTSLMVGRRTVLTVPVSCVEAGRWAYRTAKFASGGSMAHGALRMHMSRTVKEGYERHGQPASNQGGVWEEVSRKLMKMGSASPSHALHQAYEDYRQKLEEMKATLSVPADCQGVALVLHGAVAGIDVFDQPATLTKLWPKVVGSYALDALERPQPAAPISADAVRQWVQSAAQAKAEQFKSPGLGDDVRLEGAGLIGAGLLIDGHAVHVELFSKN